MDEEIEENVASDDGGSGNIVNPIYTTVEKIKK